jgi:hypothetical protein
VCRGLPSTYGRQTSSISTQMPESRNINTDNRTNTPLFCIVGVVDGNAWPLNTFSVHVPLPLPPITWDCRFPHQRNGPVREATQQIQSLTEASVRTGLALYLLVKYGVDRQCG